MRTLGCTLAAGAMVAVALSSVATGFLPGFAAGTAYMLVAAIAINTNRARA